MPAVLKWLLAVDLAFLSCVFCGVGVRTCAIVSAQQRTMVLYLFVLAFLGILGIVAQWLYYAWSSTVHGDDASCVAWAVAWVGLWALAVPQAVYVCCAVVYIKQHAVQPAASRPVHALVPVACVLSLLPLCVCVVGACMAGAYDPYGYAVLAERVCGVAGWLVGSGYLWYLLQYHRTHKAVVLAKLLAAQAVVAAWQIVSDNVFWATVGGEESAFWVGGGIALATFNLQAACLCVLWTRCLDMLAEGSSHPLFHLGRRTHKTPTTRTVADVGAAGAQGGPVVEVDGGQGAAMHSKPTAVHKPPDKRQRRVASAEGLSGLAVIAEDSRELETLTVAV